VSDFGGPNRVVAEWYHNRHDYRLVCGVPGQRQHRLEVRKETPRDATGASAEYWAEATFDDPLALRDAYASGIVALSVQLRVGIVLPPPSEVQP
jgi:hypothetical protein